MSLMLLLLSFQLEPAETELLTRALAKLERFRVGFRQETYSDFFDETFASGTLSIQRPGRMRMEYEEGEEILRIWDGSTAYEHDRASGSESRLEQDELVDEPVVRLLLYGSEITRLFLLDRFERDGEMIYRFRPRAGEEDYALEVRFDNHWLPREIEVISADGEGTRFTFSDYDLAPVFDATTFTVPPERQ